MYMEAIVPAQVPHDKLRLTLVRSQYKPILGSALLKRGGVSVRPSSMYEIALQPRGDDRSERRL